MPGRLEPAAVSLSRSLSATSLGIPYPGGELAHDVPSRRHGTTTTAPRPRVRQLSPGALEPGAMGVGGGAEGAPPALGTEDYAGTQAWRLAVFFALFCVLSVGAEHVRETRPPCSVVFPRSFHNCRVSHMWALLYRRCIGWNISSLPPAGACDRCRLHHRASQGLRKAPGQRARRAVGAPRSMR
jgi:hypothetical protein